MPSLIEQSGANVDLSPRVFYSKTVANSPTAATETIVSTLTVTGDLSAALGVILIGWMSFTVGTDGAAVTVKLRRTDTSGATVAASGATNGDVAATKLVERSISSFDAAPIPNGQVYVLTLTVGSASAGSTVSATSLTAIVI